MTPFTYQKCSALFYRAMPALTDYKIFLLTVIAACILSTLLAIFVPLDDLIISYPVMKYAIRHQHLQFRKEVLNDLESSEGFAEKVVLVFQYSLGTLMRFGKELTIMFMLLRYFPLIKGDRPCSYSNSYSSLLTPSPISSICIFRYLLHTSD